jgi:hypothetical protein
MLRVSHSLVSVWIIEMSEVKKEAQKNFWGAQKRRFWQI